MGIYGCKYIHGKLVIYLSKLAVSNFSLCPWQKPKIQLGLGPNNLLYFPLARYHSRSNTFSVGITLHSRFVALLLKPLSLCDPETLRIFAVMASTKVQRIMTQPIVRCLLHLPFLCFVQLCVLFHNVLCFFFRGVLVLQNLIFRFLQSVSPPFRFIWLILSFGFLHNACI